MPLNLRIFFFCETMVWTLCFVSDLRDSSIVILSMFNGTGAGFWVGGGCRKGVQWFFQPPPLNTVTVQSVFRKKTNKKKRWTSYILFAIFVWQAMFMWVVGAVYLSNCEFIPSYRCNMYWKVYVVGGTKLSYTDFTPSECWVILFYIYIFILIFLIKWHGVKKKTRGREAASFPLHRPLLPFLSLRVLFKTDSWEEPTHLNFMTALQRRTTKTTSSTGT